MSLFTFFSVLLVLSVCLSKSVVFEQGESGYYCIKIPYLLLTFNKTFIAFGEARINSCGDYAGTDLVYKRSIDGGNTWSNLKVLRSNSSGNVTNVIGNANPVQDRTNNRILVPHCRNNVEVWNIYSDDDGLTWSEPIGPIQSATKSDWRWIDWGWIGIGPPGGLQLTNKSGYPNRIILASYHSKVHIDGDITHGHMIISDDNGESWYISSSQFGYPLLPSESQAVELSNGSIFINSRQWIYNKRIGTISNDGGNTFKNSSFINDLRDQVTGCEGSMVKSINSEYLYYSGLTPSRNTVFRYNMTISKSINNGNNWNYIETVFLGSSAYSSLQYVNYLSNKTNDVIAILYEWSKDEKLIFIPQYTTFQLFTFPL